MRIQRYMLWHLILKKKPGSLSVKKRAIQIVNIIINLIKIISRFIWRMYCIIDKTNKVFTFHFLSAKYFISSKNPWDYLRLWCNKTNRQASFRTSHICLIEYIRIKLQKSGICLSVNNGIYNKFPPINSAFNIRF